MEEDKARIRELIRKKAGVTPYGILPTRDYTARRNKRQEEPFFGTDKSLEKIIEETIALRCPYLKEGSCTIWDYRENMCSTHFCISIGGQSGKEFWRSTNNYLKMAENVLSNYALFELGIPAGSINTSPIKSIDFALEKEDRQIDQA